MFDASEILRDAANMEGKGRNRRRGVVGWNNPCYVCHQEVKNGAGMEIHFCEGGHTALLADGSENGEHCKDYWCLGHQTVGAGCAKKFPKGYAHTPGAY
jgi:hypothetical protein